MFRRKMLIVFSVAALAVGLQVAVVLASTFPSTNDDNRDNGLPHVNLLDAGIGEATLEFVNETNSLTSFEVRIDGQTPPGASQTHPIVNADGEHDYNFVTGQLGPPPRDFVYDFVCVDNRANPHPSCIAGSLGTRTFEADETVEVRLALGGERNWDFDWVTFEVLPDAQTKEDCKNGGWRDYGFRNQGQCIRFVVTGQDSR